MSGGNRKGGLFFFIVSISFFVCQRSYAQKEYRYQNEFSTGEESQRIFGFTTTHNPKDPQLEAGGFKFELGSQLECGNIDITANIMGQFEELQKQLQKLVPQNSKDAMALLKASAFTTMCYAYPTICAQLRHDWLSIQGKLNLRAQACAAVDKFIDAQADKGARQLQSEAVAACVSQKTQGGGDVAAALSFCQTDPKAGLLFRDFQSGLLKEVSGEKQKVLKSILSFAKDETSYEFLASFLGETQVGTDGGWMPLFEKGLLRPADVSEVFMAKGQNAVCGSLESILKGRYVASGVYETQVAQVAKQKLNLQTLADLRDLSPADRQMACLALGRALGKEAAWKAISRYESALSTGLLNTAIPEPLRAEYRDRAMTAFPALREALAGEAIPTVAQVRWDLAEFARLQRAKTRLVASETNRARLKNNRGDAQSASDCLDSLSCQ